MCQQAMTKDSCIADSALGIFKETSQAEITSYMSSKAIQILRMNINMRAVCNIQLFNYFESKASKTHPV